MFNDTVKLMTPINVRMCVPDAAILAGVCQDVPTIGNLNTRACFCDTDGCNGTHKVLPTSSTIFLVVCGILIMMMTGQP